MQESKNKLKLSDKQWEFIAKANKRYNFKIGAVRSGKSFVDIAVMVPMRILEVRGKDGLDVIFGVSNGTIERNVLQPMRERYTDKCIGFIRGSKNTVRIFGEEVYCIGCEKANAVSKVQGISVKYAYGDEIAKWSEPVFKMIESRLDKPYSKFDGACNPEGPNHWLKKWLDNDKLDIYLQHYVIFDNPFLPQSFIDSLCNEYEGTVYYDRYILGKWAFAEGLIYPMYAKAIEKPPRNVPFEDYVISIDYGTENAFAALLWCKDENEVWHATDEYYYSGRDKGIPKTDEEYADDIENFAKPITDMYEQEYEEGLHDPFKAPYAAQKKLRLIIDPSAASFIATMQKRKGFKIQKADNDVANGIRETAVAMKIGAIKFSDRLKNWKDEVEGYIWDEKASMGGTDKPVKEKDHLMDSMRYAVKTLHITQKAQKRKLREG